MGKKVIIKVLIWIFFITPASSRLCSQTLEKWTINKVVNCRLNIGVLNPPPDNFKQRQKIYLKQNVYRKGSKLFLSPALKKTWSYSDTIFIGECHVFKKQKDDYISYRFPGDELACEPTPGQQNKCFVGESFMKMLGSRDSSLKVCKARGNAPHLFYYKLCVVKENARLGLLLDNSSILLILTPTKVGSKK